MIGTELLSEQMLVLNMGLLLLLGGICSILFKRLKMPVVIGYLVSGIIIAHFGWSGKETMDIVELLSDIGLALLMFCIGMELNLNKLKRMGSFAILVVQIQVPIILVGGIFLGQMILGLDSLQALIFAAVISGSSTAVVTIVLGDQGGMDRSDIESLILVTVVEDVFQVVILSAISPLMQGTTMAMQDIIWMMITIIVFMVAAVVLGIVLIPRFLDWVHKSMPSEVLIILGLGFCFGLSYISVMIGMSMAIGAFLAGVVVSQAKSSKEVEEKVTPMKDVFMMMFFISIGMQISLPSLIDNIGLIVAIYLIYFVLKFSSVILAYFIGNKPLSLGYRSSIALVAMGEFAFIISKEALDANLFSQDLYTAIVGAALVSMIVLPLVNRQNDRVINAVSTRSPAFLQRGYHNLDVKRGVLYTRLSFMSAGSVTSFRKKMATAYFSVVLIIIVELVFFVFTDELIDFINGHTEQAVTPALCAVIVLLLNFLILIVPVYNLLKHLKYLQRVFLDSNRRAIAAGHKHDSRFDRFVRVMVRGNMKLIAAAISFVVTMVLPVDVDLFGRLIVLASGALIIAQIAAYRRIMRE